MASARAIRLSPSVEKQKLKLELLRGSKPKLENLPVSVVVHEHSVRAGCMFFGTTTSPWAKSEKVTVWSHEREQRFDTSNLFFNL